MWWSRGFDAGSGASLLNQGVFQVASHGGKRLGSGRKSKQDKILAEAFFGSVITPDDLARILRSHLSSGNEKIAFDAATWLADHMFGKAVQKNENTGPEGEPIAIRVVADV